ncbi:MAG: hypothetical protein WC740_16575 [Verrucomicrobiia bacterium]
MARHLCTDLDKFLPQRRQRPMPHRSGQYELAREAFREALEASPGYAGAEEALQDVEGALNVVRGELQ